MKTREDEKWLALLARSFPTFAGEEAPPYGFMAATLARLREETRETEEFESIGWRALLSSFVTLIVVIVIGLGFQVQNRADLEPGVNNILEVENVALS